MIRTVILLICFCISLQASANQDSSARLNLSAHVAQRLMLKLMMVINEHITIDHPQSNILVASFGVISNLNAPYVIKVSSQLGNGKLVRDGKINPKDTGINYGLRFGSSGPYVYFSSTPTVIYISPVHHGYEDSIYGPSPKLWLYATHPGAGGQAHGLYEDKIVFTIEPYDD